MIEQEISLGEFLRHHRENSSLSIEQVASATKIGVRTLHLLEENHYSELPAKPFVRGFVIAYCRFIGLEPKEVIKKFDDYITKRSFERPLKDSGHSGYAFEKKEGEQQGRTPLMIAMISFIILGGIIMVILKPQLKHHKRSDLAKLKKFYFPLDSKNTPTLFEHENFLKQQNPFILTPSLLSPSMQLNRPISLPLFQSSSLQVPTPIEDQEAANKNFSHSPASETQGNKTPEENKNDPLDSGRDLNPSDIRYKMIATMKADVYVRYQVDDKPWRSFLVHTNRILVLRAKEKVWFQVSNPRSIALSYNGQANKLFSDFLDVQNVNETATLFYPSSLYEKIKNELSTRPPLPQTPDLKEENEVSFFKKE